MQRDNYSQFAKNRAVFAFGGNLDSSEGGVADTIASAIDTLGYNSIDVTACSKFYQTPCFPEGMGPDYVNLVAIVETTLPPHQLLDVLHRIEAQFQRARGVRWAGRTLDIDILAYENCILPNLEVYTEWRDLPAETQRNATPEQLILPHPRIEDRGFVLIPLCEVWPDWRHPVSGKTAQMLCDALPASEINGIKPL
ncbi:2-amino-4-hydroxy-6-hydroxymethyldihydropteridine diphosphokinase [Pacificibacter maritimus]|uniref:2-amino-4-hydroxy-6-hydroxymethyldihydropteridine pyrophosphokinase n=1 Tax=Pacificibacter maritimus TaxID=762213 RepID=A0A3N4U7Z2_9RHOB|nr:2-amino-4-hydroxy-6-hydroxymethyldihydropteridine diphosphokinase [Pacificibacter maritimus]RPE63221.1 2-amino-4-hydroxy-6-hydroxymethyldihydropteridine diphosphokinase [Pacificibacter maritimus]